MQRWVFIVAIVGSGCGDDVASPGDEGSSSSDGTGSTGLSTTTGPGSSASASATSVSTSSGATTSTDDTSSGSADSSSTAAPEACGDGNLGGDEECDDGNTDDGDACSSTCEIPFTIAWTQTYDGADNLADMGNGVAVTDDGSIYVVGSTFSLAQTTDIFLRQYAADGTTAWTETHDGPTSGRDSVAAVAVHTSGDLIVVGTMAVALGEDVFVRRIATDDQSVVWEAFYDGAFVEEAGDFGDRGLAVAIDVEGDVFVAGQERGADGSHDMLLVRFDADGEELWHVTHSTNVDAAVGVTVDASGVAWLAGTMDLTGERNGWIGGHDAEGTLGAEQSFPDLEVRGVTRDPTDVLVLCGRRFGGTSPDAISFALDESLTSDWIAVHDGPAMREDVIFAVAAAPDGDLYVTGYETVEHLGYDHDVFVARLSGIDDAPIWSDRYDGGVDQDDSGNAIAVGPDGSIVVVGFTNEMGQDSNVLVRKYIER